MNAEWCVDAAGRRCGVSRLPVPAEAEVEFILREVEKWARAAHDAAAVLLLLMLARARTCCPAHA